MNKWMLPLWSAAILLPGLVYSAPDEQRDELQPLNQHQRQKSQQQQVTAVAPCVCASLQILPHRQRPSPFVMNNLAPPFHK